MTETKTGAPAWAYNLHDRGQGMARRLAPGITTRIFAGEQLMLSVVRIDPYTTGEVHSHPEEQWGVLLEGQCTRIQSGEEIPMTAGDFWHTPGGTPHGIRTGDTAAVVLDVFSPPRAGYKVAGEGF